MAQPLSTLEYLRGAGLSSDVPISLSQTLNLATGSRLRAAIERLRTTSVFEFRAKLPPGAVVLAVGVDELQQAVLERMAGSQEPRDIMVWSRDGAEMLVHVPCALQLTGGYLLAHFHVETVETGPIELKLVFFLGNVDAGAGKAASVTHSTDAPDAIIDAWGDTLRAAVWEGVLDIIEGAAVLASQAAGDVPLRVLGFIGGENRILIAVGA
ncbi:MAG: hypothetical protein IPM54_26905 [Polyangiaceae bacterium]|nr:hypothetical protein [Polyangiaceae bacterium]